jgi:NAD-dependent dihydropyrimidine dehydrogenase PreA subunit
MCGHCDDAPCLAACPVDGAIIKREDGLVLIDPQKCTGCRDCADACPDKVIYFNEDLNIAQKCTGCAHLLDDGWKEPRCVDACPTEALKFGEESELKELIGKAEVLSPESGAKPRAFAKNVTSIGHYFGGSMIRGAYSHEPARLEVILLAMQGLGRPGVHQCQISYVGMPRSGYKLDATLFMNPAYPDLRFAAKMKQFIPKTLVANAILDPPVSSWGSTRAPAKAEDQFIKYTYPVPEEKGNSTDRGIQERL